MSTKRADGRRPNELREVEIVRGYTRSAPGSVLIRSGGTMVLCTATVDETLPAWRAGRTAGWVTAEYDMLPGSTGQRRSRQRTRVDGRASEIQRLIGRVMRSVVDLEALGPRSIWLDCDVLQADGGTRTASITGAYVALCDAVRDLQARKLIEVSPVMDGVAAVSVGKVDGRLLLDLDYTEDVRAEVDFNVAMTSKGRFIEVQGTAEGSPFTRAELDRMIALASGGIRQLLAAQKKALAAMVASEPRS